jgi:HD domain
VVGPSVVRGGRVRVAPRESSRLLAQVHRQPDLVTVKVWRADGVLAWTSRDPRRIGHRFELEGDLGETLRTGQAHGSIDQLSSDEDKVERSLGFDHMLEIYAPIKVGRTGRTIGAYEIYADPKTLEGLVSSRRHLLWVALAVVFLALYVALALLVRGASKLLRSQTERLRRRSRELLESYNRLEQSSLEAIETLNATVEAKDPYTAGHSQRVQQIALAVGKELGLSGERLDALRYAGLFHDIGSSPSPTRSWRSRLGWMPRSSRRSSGTRRAAPPSSASSVACARACRSSATTTSAGTAAATRTDSRRMRCRSRRTSSGSPTRGTR